MSECVLLVQVELSAFEEIEFVQSVNNKKEKQKNILCASFADAFARCPDFPVGVDSESNSVRESCVLAARVDERSQRARLTRRRPSVGLPQRRRRERRAVSVALVDALLFVFDFDPVSMSLIEKRMIELTFFVVDFSLKKQTVAFSFRAELMCFALIRA